MYSPFDLNEAMSHRKEWVEEAFRAGSPVVGLAYFGGLLLLTVRRSQRKVYEIYDRQMFAALGRQADIENIRLASIQLAHQEGFDRSPDDVSVQRLVGFSLSPALKKAFGEQFATPFVVRALFAETGRIAAGDTFYTLDYDGEFRQYSGSAVIAGTHTAEDKMAERLGESSDRLGLHDAVRRALSAWSVGAREAMRRRGDTRESDDLNPLRDLDEGEADAVFLRDELKTGTLEVGLLERRSTHETRFRLMTAEELAPLVG